MHRQPLLDLLSRHRTRFMEEAAYVQRAYQFVQSNPECFNRHNPAHITGSSWVINPSRDHVLMLHHRKYDQWFQPGGHPEDEVDVLQVALRETTEETGVSLEQIHLLDHGIFDVDIHSAPVGEEGIHQHVDIRFLVEIDDALHLPGNVESHEVRWVPLADVPRFNNNRSTFRMVEKTRQLRRHWHRSAARR